MIKNCSEIKLRVINDNTANKYVSIDVELVDSELSEDFMIDREYALLFMYERFEFRLQERDYSFNGLHDSAFTGEEYRTKHIFFNHPSKSIPTELNNMTVLKLLLKAVMLMTDKHSKVRDEFLNNIKTTIRQHGLRQLEND